MCYINKYKYKMCYINKLALRLKLHNENVTKKEKKNLSIVFDWMKADLNES